MTDDAIHSLQAQIRQAKQHRIALRIRGAGTKDFLGIRTNDALLDTTALVGEIAYDPSELVLTAPAGTRLSTIDSLLATQGQCLAFEPPRFGGDPTLGGLVSSGLSGPGRMRYGGVRDHVLGAHLMNSDGEILRFGGRVMKNVAGFDVSRLLCGAWGVLGVLTEVSIKVLPRPAAVRTQQLAMGEDQALKLLLRLSTTSNPVSAAAWHQGVVRIRLAGAEPAVMASARTLGGDEVAQDIADSWWSSIRDQTHSFFTTGAPVWRLSLPPNLPPLPNLGTSFIEWSGQLRWATNEPDEATREIVSRSGGHVAPWRGTGRDSGSNLTEPLMRIHEGLKAHFDPLRIFNPDRLVKGL
jgi:glycolate oxidase FAD binding subunit